MSRAPDWVRALVNWYDPDVLSAPGRRLRVELRAPEQGAWEVVLDDAAATVAPSSGRPDATIAADPATWERIATSAAQALAAYLAGRPSARRNLHVGVGFLAATSGSTGAARMRFRYVGARNARLSTVEAGEAVVLAVRGLSGTKGSFLPTVAALSDRFRVIPLDLPGFGDSDKPIGAAYDARFFASACVDLLDALELDRVGGRVALEVGIVRLLIPGANGGWAAAGVDDLLLRAYLTPSGRAAFYAAARHIYLDEPHGVEGFWPRLEALEPDALFIWGRDDKLVPIGFKRHVADALPRAHHLELDCGHVPQIERPGPANEAIAVFFSQAPVAARPGSETSGSKRAAA